MKLTSKILALATLAALMSSAVPTVFAQAPAAPQAPVSGPIVRSIDVQYAGPVTISRDRVLANMRTQVGKPYAEQAVAEDIRNLMATGKITNARIFGEPVQNGVRVIVVVQSKATVGDVVIQGATQIKEARLRKQLKLKTGETLSESTMEQDRQKMLEEYDKAGFSGTNVSYQVVTDEKTGSAKVTYSIKEGGKSTIRSVNFEGNSAISTKELRKVMKTRPKNLLSFITKTGKVQNDQLDQDILSLRELYQNRGYIDADVSLPVITTTPDGKTDILIRIREGQQYSVGKVAVTGARVFPVDEINEKITMRGGETFSAKTLRDDAKAIQDMYGARGYIDMQVKAVTLPAGRGIVNVDYNIEEGGQSYVEMVSIQGNTRTKDKVIRRELAVAPGDVYNTVRIDASKQRLQNLNYFSKIDTYPTDTLVPGRKDLNVLVEEKRTGSFNFGAGFSSIDNLIGFAEITQGNFDITNWPAFTGGGQKFRARAQYGTERKDFIISLIEPWFLDYQLAVGGEAFYREASFVSNVYSQRNYGFEVNARKPINNFTAARLAYRLENIDIYDVDSSASDLIKAETGSQLKSSVTAGITYDTRDSVFLTRRGQRIDLSGYLAGGFLGGEVQDGGFDLEASQYFPLPWDTILLLNGEIAGVGTWGGGDRVPIFDRLFLGGSNNLRGFSYREVGPKDVNGEPIGGGALARATVEFTFPVIEKVRGAVFYDVGFVNTGAFNYIPRGVNSDFGFGVRIDLPIGPVRLDYGIPIQSDRFNDSSGKFNFNIGYQF
jgi:outer membrane protein insertion porin family